MELPRIPTGSVTPQLDTSPSTHSETFPQPAGEGVSLFPELVRYTWRKASAGATAPRWYFLVLELGDRPSSLCHLPRVVELLRFTFQGNTPCQCVPPSVHMIWAHLQKPKSEARSDSGASQPEESFTPGPPCASRLLSYLCGQNTQHKLPKEEKVCLGLVVSEGLSPQL